MMSFLQSGVGFVVAAAALCAVAVLAGTWLMGSWKKGFAAGLGTLVIGGFAIVLFANIGTWLPMFGSVPTEVQNYADPFNANLGGPAPAGRPGE